MLFIEKSCITLLIAVTIVAPFNNVNAQHEKKSKKYFEKALEAFHTADYENALIYSLLSVKADSLNVQAFLLISDISAEINNEKQYQWALNKVVLLKPNSYTKVYKLLANSYFKQGRFENALKCFKNYMKYGIRKDSAFVSNRIEHCQAALELINNKYDVKISHLDTTINSSENEYWPFISADDSTIYFTRLITHERPYVFERLFFSERTASGWSPSSKLEIGNTGEVNEGTLSMTADGNLLFFTACGRRDGMGSCDIYYLLKVNGRWQQPLNAGATVNTRFWEAQPAVSANGEMLFWSSNREGGLGGKDIWMASIQMSSYNKLSFGTPVNLGSGVNTPMNDYSPFIHADDRTLYFASDGHYGLGKSDLFVSRLVGSVWTAAQNLGYPINSIADDDGLVVSPTTHIALFSSNREGSFSQSKDIYQLKLPDVFLPAKAGYVKGYVYDALTRKKIGALIEISVLGSSHSWTVEADKQEGYLTTLKPMQQYAFNVLEKGYLLYSENFDFKHPQNFKEATVYNIYLQPVRINAKVVLKNIFFEFDSYELDSSSVAELKKIVSFLDENPSVKIEISGYTDNVGSKSYNQQLSEKRAKAISLYLEKCIPGGRITSIGYGDQKPVASNDTAEGRRRNRRSELRIVDY